MVISQMFRTEHNAHHDSAHEQQHRNQYALSTESRIGYLRTSYYPEETTIHPIHGQPLDDR